MLKNKKSLKEEEEEAGGGGVESRPSSSLPNLMTNQ